MDKKFEDMGIIEMANTIGEMGINLELLQALQALGTYPGGYCFCREGRSSGEFNAFGNAHTGECEDARKAIARAEEGKV